MTSSTDIGCDSTDHRRHLGRSHVGFQRRWVAIAMLTPGLMVAAACGPSIDDSPMQGAASPSLADAQQGSTAPESAADPAPALAPEPADVESAAADSPDPTAAHQAGSRRTNGAATAAQVDVVSDVPGDGPSVSSSDCVALDLKLGVAERGTPVTDDGGAGGNDPMVISPDDADVIPGLREGIDDMAVGGSRQLFIPTELAYGSDGWGDGAVKPDESLDADVSVLWAGDGPSWSWSEARDARASGKGHLTIGDAPASTPAGSGLSNDSRAMALVASLQLDSESVVESNWPSCQAQPLDLDSLEMAGWVGDELTGMQPGETRMLIGTDNIPTGDQGQPNAWLITLVGLDG